MGKIRSLAEMAEILSKFESRNVLSTPDGNQHHYGQKCEFFFGNYWLKKKKNIEIIPYKIRIYFNQAK